MHHAPCALQLGVVNGLRQRKYFWCFSVCAVLILLVECVVFNAPYWASIKASTDSVSASNVLGSGLHRTASGLVRVSDPAQAYFEVDADGSSSYYRADMLNESAVQLAKQADERSGVERVRTTVHLRAQVHGVSSPSVDVSPYSSRSSYFRGPSKGSVRIWVEEPAGSLIPIRNIRANVRVPFSFNITRVLCMALIVLCIALWRPGSWLWNIALDTSNTKQRRVALLALIACAVPTLWVIGTHIASAGPARFHTEGGYVYDFDQYGHVANALLHGHTWLDLPVSNDLLHAAHPYDVAFRDSLNTQGSSPLYWDYAFYQGHWYSYFGVIPAVVLFLPFQLLTGTMLPSACAELLLMFGVLVFGCLLVIRLLSQLHVRVSLAAASMCCVLFLLGSNCMYLWFRTNFYSIPFASSLLLVFVGLWLWLGAQHTGTALFTRADRVSLMRVGAGALCIAATLGCRPTFSLCALFAFPIFSAQWRACWYSIRHQHALRPALRWLMTFFIPALCIVIPVLWYNYARFGSLFDFGNSYQFTVTDMTQFHTPHSNMLTTIGYYLALPLTLIRQFPFMAITPTPMPAWSYTEPCVGGLLVMVPAAIAAFAVPWMRKKLALSGLYATATTSLALGIVLLLVDSYVGGFAWRYKADFGWLFMIGAICVWALIIRSSRSMQWVFTLLTWYSIIVAIMALFVIGREDALIVNAPALYHEVQSWFTLLP